jgi:hypothetical protein
MNSYQQMAKRLTPLLFLFCIFSTSVQAGDIDGIAGYALGDVLDKKHVLREKVDAGMTVYRVKPIAPDPQIDLLTVRTTDTLRIHRISAYTTVLTDKACQHRMTQLRIETEKQFPELGYYAMADGDLFYQDDRTYTLDCVKTEDGIRLRREYSDDKLAKQ